MRNAELSVSKSVVWAGATLAALTGLLHLVEAPEYFGEVRYIGALFVVNALGGLVAAYGIWRGSRLGWLLGLAVAGGALAAYILSRTVGLPDFREASLAEAFEPMGVLCALVETAFIAVFLRT
jgi:hypothetical protein